MARQGAATKALLGFDSMNKSLYRAAQEFAKLFFRQGDAAGAVQHDVTVYVRPERKRNFPDIVFFQRALLHFGRKQVRNGIQRGRKACTKIFRELTGPRTWTRKNKVEDTRLGKSIIDIGSHDREQAVFEAPVRG